MSLLEYKMIGSFEENKKNKKDNNNNTAVPGRSKAQLKIVQRNESTEHLFLSLCLS